MSSSLDITCPSPRVNFQSLGQFVGKRVTIVGSVVGVDGNTLQLKTSDDQVVNIQMQGAVPQVRGAAPTAVVSGRMHLCKRFQQ
jgi:RNase P/RNase MRP subunit p29